jgi:hypothetical protein
MNDQTRCLKVKNVTLLRTEKVEMATGTRNPSTRRVLPDKEAGME